MQTHDGRSDACPFHGGHVHFAWKEVGRKRKGGVNICRKGRLWLQKMNKGDKSKGAMQQEGVVLREEW